MLAGPAGYQPPDAPLSRGLEVHPQGGAEDLEIWIDRRYVPAGYGWSFPAGEETRIGVGSFDPKFHVRETTELLAEDLERDRVRYQGNWIPHKLRQATGRGVFFAGDSAGHCLPLTAEGIRTALYFGMALGRELRGVVEGRQSREEAAPSYAAFNDSHEVKFKWMLRVQKIVPRIPPRLLGPLIRLFGVKRLRRLVLRPLPGRSPRRSSPHGGTPEPSQARGRRPPPDAYLAFSQSVPTPASTSSGGSSW